MQLFDKFYPITATPFKRNEGYIEIEPCDELKPFIRCFWGSVKPYKQINSNRDSFEVVVPDTCADIIFRVNYSQNKISSDFCGIDDMIFTSFDKHLSDDMVSIFGVRFYAWSAVLFSEEDMSKTKNQFFDAGIHFEKFKTWMEKILFEIDSIEQRILIAESCLLKLLNPQKEDPLFMRAVSKIIECNGNMKALELATDLRISSKQIERIFHKNMGVTPKKAATLIRYQSLWQEACFNPEFQVLDSVFKLGYVDQAHLLNDFKRMHGMSLSEARAYAQQNVDFLQEER